jgi:hypothetical protein
MVLKGIANSEEIDLVSEVISYVVNRRTEAKKRWTVSLKNISNWQRVKRRTTQIRSFSSMAII